MSDQGLPISPGTLADSVPRFLPLFEPFDEAILTHQSRAAVRHGDETVWRIQSLKETGRSSRAWLRTSVSDDAVYFHIDPSRSAKVATQLFGGTACILFLVCDRLSFCGPDPPAALFRYSRDRSGDHPVEHLRTFTGILQADAYAGYRRLHEPGRSPGSVTEALCWAHGRRKFYELADIAAGKRRGESAPPISPLALEAVRRIDAVFDIEREINGETAERRVVVRRERSAPLVAELEDWMRTERARLSRHADVAKAMDYMLKRWDGFARFLDDGRICLTNNAAERALRPLCLGRKSWLFAGSDRGGERAAVMYTLIGTAKLNDVDPQAWLADVLARIADMRSHPA